MSKFYGDNSKSVNFCFMYSPSNGDSSKNQVNDRNRDAFLFLRLTLRFVVLTVRGGLV